MIKVIKQKLGVFILLSLLGLSCNQLDEKSVNEQPTLENENRTHQSLLEEQLPVINIENHNSKYTQLKKNIQNFRNELKRKEITELDKIKLSENYISNILIDSIFEYWEGTKWDFNGHTKKPKDGEIACGYYITTTLKDVGIKLNRIKLAQQASSVMIKKLCLANSVKIYSDVEKLMEYLEKIENNEILILGLDYHVGFVFKRDNKNYFAHSNYIDSRGVVKEILSKSAAIKSSNIYMIGRLTKNKQLIKDWLN